MSNLTEMLIDDLLKDPYCFFIPSYQRGYRWTGKEVRKLLNDLFDFYELKRKNNTSIGDFYCLQPISFKRMNSDNGSKCLEIIDGQQRLTTIYLILKKVLRSPDQLFEIRYERDDCNHSRQQFLEELSNNNYPEPKNVDEHYFTDAFKEIGEWFEKKINDRNVGTRILNNMEQMLLEYTKFIFYELEPESDSYSLFKNLNKGKIPLTDAELVKAMLLNSRNFYGNNNDVIIRQKQDYYARFWDEIQKYLNDDSVWFFITAGVDLDIPNRIDLLFQLDIKRKGVIIENSDDEDYRIFNYYEDELNQAEDKE